MAAPLTGAPDDAGTDDASAAESQEQRLLEAFESGLLKVMSKMGIAFEQLVLSSLLADSSTAQWFMPANFALLLVIAAAQALLFFWALPQSGLSKAERHAPAPAETP